MKQDELTIYRDGTIEANFPLNAPDLRRMATRLLQLAEMHEPLSDSPTDLDPIRGNSPDERENPDTEEQPNSVRAIVKNIHTAAQQSRRTATASARTLLYIDMKIKEAIGIRIRDRHLKSTLYHIKAMIVSTNTAEQKIIRIEQITATALDLPFQEVQS